MEALGNCRQEALVEEFLMKLNFLLVENVTQAKVISIVPISNNDREFLHNVINAFVCYDAFHAYLVIVKKTSR